MDKVTFGILAESNFRIRLKYFSGRRTKEEKPVIGVIEINSNDIDFPQLRLNNVENIGKDITNIGKKCRKSRIFKVIISSALVKNNIKVTKFIRHLNYFLRNLCLMNDFYFISNNNISRDFIFQDGVYLNKDGACILAGYFVDFVSTIDNF